MRTVSAQSVLEGVLRREGGGSITEANASDAEVAKFFDYIADRLRTAWEFHPWLETFVVEKRFFREVWAVGATYAEDDEVYFEGTVSGYFVALEATLAGESPDTHPAKWLEVAELRRLVEFEQAGESAFEGCAAAYAEDPLTSPRARQLNFTLTGDGVVIDPGQCAPDGVWLKLIKRCEDFAAVRWTLAGVYAAGRRIYFATTGEVYEVVTTTTATESPLTAAAKFRLLEFPYIFARAVKSGALADWMRSDGASDKASAEESQFYRLLDEQKMRLVTQQGQRGRIRFAATSARTY